MISLKRNFPQLTSHVNCVTKCPPLESHATLVKFHWRIIDFMNANCLPSVASDTSGNTCLHRLTAGKVPTKYIYFRIDIYKLQASTSMINHHARTHSKSLISCVNLLTHVWVLILNEKMDAAQSLR